MEKRLIFLSSLFIVMAFITNIAFSNVMYDFTVATVNLPVVVNNSKGIKNLKDSTKIQTEEIATFISKAKDTLGSETDIKKRKILEDKYNNELRQKKDRLAKHNARKIESIDKSIHLKIAKIAKKQGFSIVLAKNAVLYGGEDITDKVISR